MGGTRLQLRLPCELLSGLRAVHPGVLQGSVLPAACHGLSSSSPKASPQELSVLVGCHRWPLPTNLLRCLIRGVSQYNTGCGKPCFGGHVLPFPSLNRFFCSCPSTAQPASLLSQAILPSALPPSPRPCESPAPGRAALTARSCPRARAGSARQAAACSGQPVPAVLPSMSGVTGRFGGISCSTPKCSLTLCPALEKILEPESPAVLVPRGGWLLSSSHHRSGTQVPSAGPGAAEPILSQRLPLHLCQHLRAEPPCSWLLVPTAIACQQGCAGTRPSLLPKRPPNVTPPHVTPCFAALRNVNKSAGL